MVWRIRVFGIVVLGVEEVKVVEFRRNPKP